MPKFHTTLMGKRFIEGTMPSIMQSLDRIANALEKMNEEPQCDLLINEITKVSPEVQEALSCITEDIVKTTNEKIRSMCGSDKYITTKATLEDIAVPKSASVKSMAEKLGVPCIDLAAPTLEDSLSYAEINQLDPQVIKFLKDGGTISNIRAWRYISNAMRTDNVDELFSLVNIFFGEEVANKFIDYIAPKEAVDDTN